MSIGSVIPVADNSGARLVRVIKILRKQASSISRIGDFLIVSVIRVNPRKRMKKGIILKAMVIRSPITTKRKDSHRLRFQKGAVAIVDKDGHPRSTKIHGPVSKEIRELGFVRIISLGSLAL